MSYLAPLRIHFAGRFQAAPSTVNNIPGNYLIAQSGRPQSVLWNSRGNGDWRLIGCAVTSAFGPDGTQAAANDPVRGLLVADSDRQVAAKLVDLDPQQQLASKIWGLEVRLADANGRSRLVGRFAPASFVGIWSRTTSDNPGLSDAAAEYQSVLTDLEWGAVEDSGVLRALKTAAEDSGVLSIKFNVDGYSGNSTSPTFTRGRLVGTLGPAEAGEPHHMIIGRRLIARPVLPRQRIFQPLGKINFCSALVDEGRKTVTIDLGNALQTVGPGGRLADHGRLTLGCQPAGQPQPTVLGRIDYTVDRWYPETAGVVSLPLTDAQLSALRTAPLIARLDDVPDPTAEARDGRYVRADTLVRRLDPGDTVELPVFASVFGRPASDAVIVTANDPAALQAAPAALPLAVSYPDQLPRTDASGRTMLAIVASNPGNPRPGIDGQLYGIRVQFAGPPQRAADLSDLVSLLVSSAYAPRGPITWHDHIQLIFTQYANLYPVMGLFLDLADYDSVCAQREMLALAFNLGATDPNSMPVTRDLSRDKRAAILRWLTVLGPDGLPLRGTPPGPSAGPLESLPADEDLERAADPDSKGAAAARRLGYPDEVPDGAES